MIIMNRKKRQVVFLAAIVVIVFAFSACTTPATTGTTQRATTTQPAGTTSGTQAPTETEDLTHTGGIKLPLVESAITLTWFWDADPKATAVIPSYDKMAYFEDMARRTNITIEFMHPPAGQAGQQFSLMLSTGDLPDFVWYNWTQVPGGIATLIDDGSILDITDYMDEYAPNITRIFKDNPDMYKQGTLDDGTFFSFPKIKGDSSILVTTGLQIRKDWLDRLDLDAPDTIDDWYHVLTEFKNKDANGNGDPNDEIPYVGRSATLPLDGLSNAWNLMFFDFSMRGDQVVYGPLLPEYRDFVETMAKWYAEGLIDPDYLSTDTNAFESKVIGNIGGSYMGTINGNMGKFLDTWKKAGLDDYDLIPLPNAKKTASGQRYGRHVQSFISADGAAITSNNKYFAESIQYLDYGYSPEGIILSNYGIEGESFTYVNNQPKFTDLILKNPSGYPVINALHLYNFAVSQGPGIQLSDAFFQTASHERLIDCYVIFSEGHTKINMPNLAAGPEESARLANIMGDVKTLVEEKVNQFIMGIEPISKYDDFVQLLINANIEEALAIQQGMLDRFNSKQD